MSDDALAQLKSEISLFANAVDRLRDMIIAYKAASMSDVVETDALYWPHLLETLQEMIPSDEGLNRALIRMHKAVAARQ